MHTMTPHDRQTAPLRWQMQFNPVRKCVPLARSLAAKALTSWGYGQEDIDRVVLVCDELSANAVEHGNRRGHLFEVRLTADGPHCLVEVSDATRTPPHSIAAGEDDEGGRGLLLVAALAEEIGHHDRHPVGKTVWARLSLGTPKEDETSCTS
ncbi:ATP-binding protein [Streptomyces beijiangensis]|uniref:ATP-binding protein n=1 Tax=Streptomyces beijiangensis TaxID=163361 RepID=A0A939JGU6_9ACTN|nr:ATP-binding protein [Streptomyces beijiangensis]MBO0511937.1 ATP-binding protein [Streptomyces beijiangensis]